MDRFSRTDVSGVALGRHEPSPRRPARRCPVDARRGLRARRRSGGRGERRPRSARRRRRPGSRGRGVAGERRRRRAHLRAVVADRPGAQAGRLRRRQPARARLRVGAARRGDPPRPPRGHQGDAHRVGAGAGVDEPLARPRQPALQARPGRVRGLRDRGGEPLRRRRRPLHPLERAEPAVVAPAPGELRAPALHARRPAPLPGVGARGVPRDQGGRPRGGGADRGAVLARARHEGAQLDAAAAGVPARAGLRLVWLRASCAAGTARASSPRRRTASRSTRTAR